MDKSSSEQQIRESDDYIWIVREKTGALGLVLPGLTAGRQAGRQADEIILSLEIFKIL